MQQFNYISGLFLFLFVWCSCDKTSLTEPEKNISLTKVFNDTLADPNNGTLKIAAGSNRFYMAYGSGNLTGYNNSWFTRPIQFWMMVTDYEGNLIRRETLPAGLSVEDVLVLEDGSMMLAAVNYTSDVHSNHYFLFHYDENGAPLSFDSIILPPSFDFGGNIGTNAYNTSGVGLLRADQGNFIMYGGYKTTSGPEAGFIVECDAKGKMLRSAKTDLPLFCGVQTADHGYLFNSEIFTSPYIYLIKTNASGEMLWSKQFAIKEEHPYCRQIIRTVRNTYQFCFNVYTYGNPGIPFYLYEVNENGDSLATIVIDEKEQSWAGAIIPRDDGSTLALINKPWTNIVYANAYYDQLSTRFALVNSKFKLEEKQTVETETSNLFSAACKTSNGRIACFGIIQSYNKGYYKPVLLILDSKLSAL